MWSKGMKYNYSSFNLYLTPYSSRIHPFRYQRTPNKMTTAFFSRIPVQETAAHWAIWATPFVNELRCLVPMAKVPNICLLKIVPEYLRDGKLRISGYFVSANLWVSGSARKRERYYLYSPKIITVCEDKMSTLPVILLFECSFLGTSAIPSTVFCDSTHTFAWDMMPLVMWCNAKLNFHFFLLYIYSFSKTTDGKIISEHILSVQYHRLPNPCFVLKYVALKSLIFLGYPYILWEKF